PAETSPKEDRQAHRHSFRFDGVAKRITASFHVACKKLKDRPQGLLALAIEMLPEGTPSPATWECGEEVMKAPSVANMKLGKSMITEKRKFHELQSRANREIYLLDPDLQE